MLELKSITKDYLTGDQTVHALRGISLQFRKNEFVSILGPSGCGKTTLLNIIGGLDQYTTGDLLIGGRSTRDFRDRDWDAYRNHSIGFVFQSYNLIAHQTVLQNVELALTLSGVSKAERRRRAVAALESVGLGSQLRKKPGEMSGGQMQRVAIARALVNNPDIILADEPTGALDSETSVQVMDILKEVSRDRLVIMVTHNPELADRYSTRIIRMLDGALLDDSAPLSEDELRACREEEQQQRRTTKKREKKPSMGLLTAFGLSLKNLISKRSRTALTSFAGSIGIIGIALIFAVSQGMTTYIDTLQEDTLSSYPLTIEATHMDLGSLMSAFLEKASSGVEHENDAVYSKPLVYDMINALNDMETTTNDLHAFRDYLEAQLADEESTLSHALSGVQYSYDLDLRVYTQNVDGTVLQSDSLSLLQELAYSYLGMDLSGMMEMQEQSGMMSVMSGPMTSRSIWQEMLPGKDGSLISDLLYKQYDLVYGSWPNQYNEIVLVVDEHNELDDMTLYALGLKSEAEMQEILDAAINKTALPVDIHSWSYADICSMEFRVVLPSDCYTLDESTGLYLDLRQTDAGLRYLYDNGLALKVTGIIRPNEDAVSTILSGSIGYTSELTKHIITKAAQSAVVQAQMAQPDTDIFTGLPFQSNTGTLTEAEKEAELRSYLKELDTPALASTYIRIMSIPSQEELDAMVGQSMASVTTEDMRATLTQALVQEMGMNEASVTEYIGAMSDDELTELFTEMVTKQATQQYAAQVAAQLAPFSDDELAAALTAALPNYTTAQCAAYYDVLLTFSDSSYEDNLIELGCLELDDPAAISLYTATFESKDVIEDAINTYNSGVNDELKEIKYTDYVGLMMSSVTTIINAITYVLAAFVAISLIVSSIMIGVITLISVQERTKEIGILRAIGASKKNVSSMFNAETVIIGFASGALGIALTCLLCLPINAIIQHLTGIDSLRAYLPWQVGVILVLISILLSVIAGIIPARSAAKKDPVVALRTE